MEALHFRKCASGVTYVGKTDIDGALGTQIRQDWTLKCTEFTALWYQSDQPMLLLYCQ